jgi:hypothetical protein
MIHDKKGKHTTLYVHPSLRRLIGVHNRISSDDAFVKLFGIKDEPRLIAGAVTVDSPNLRSLPYVYIIEVHMSMKESLRMMIFSNGFEKCPVCPRVSL